MKLFLASVLACLAAGAAFAQAVPRILSPYDIERFIRDVPAMTAEMEAAGSGFDREVANSQNDPARFSPTSVKAVLSEAKTSPEVRRVLAKYGWDARFWDVYYAIFSGVYVSMMDQALVRYPSPELKAQVDLFRASISRDDHTLVLRNLERLLEVFEALDEE